jgi:transposase
MRLYQDKKQYARDVLLRLLGDGVSHTDDDLSRITGYSVSWVKQLRHQYKMNGASAIAILEQQTGASPKLSDTQLLELKNILDKGAEAYGLEGAFWDRKRVKQVILDKFSVEYSIGHLSSILSKLNYSLQRPRKKDYRQSTEKVEIWKMETLPEIKKK